LTEARVTDFYADKNDCVVGVRIRCPDRSIEHVGCETLVLATCGFGGNNEMITTLIPEMSDARYFCHEGNRGDGILWGKALGGAVGDMSAYQGLGTLAVPHQIVVPHPLLIEGGFLVNIEERRFAHELSNISGMCVPVLAQAQGLAWVVSDECLNRDSLEHSVDQRKLEEVGAIRRGNSWAALERVCNLPLGSLRRENDEIGAARAGNYADRFGRRHEGPAALKSPFCAVRVTGAIFHTQGGLLIDGNAQVIRDDRSPLPNLYAGGGVARSISGKRVTGYLPGASDFAWPSPSEP